MAESNVSFNYFMKPVILLLPFLFLGAGCASVGLTTVTVPTSVNTTSSTGVATSTRPDHDDTVYTEKDFSGFGVIEKYQDQIRDMPEYFFHVQISPQVPVYTFHVVSTDEKTNTVGYIEVFRGPETAKPLQTIKVHPEFLGNAPLFFNVHDINFDGYSDIGIVQDGGALWGSYQYWVFEPASGLFVTSPATDDFRKLSMTNNISFDTRNRRITTDELVGVSIKYHTIYQFQNGRILPLEEDKQENVMQNPEDNSSSPALKCILTTTKYVGKKETVTTNTVMHGCE